MANPRKQFDVLVLDYTMAREDERTFFNIQVAVAAITVALLAGLATLLSATCQVNSADDCTNLPPELLAAAPSIPFAALALLQILGASAALRSYYMRALEKELRDYAETPLPELATVAEIRPPSYAGLLAELATLRRGRGGYRILAILIMLITFLAFAGLTVYIALDFSKPYRVPMLIVYGTAFAFLVFDVASVTLGARSTFIRIARRFAVRQEHSLFEGASLQTSNGRSLAAYLLVPRPEDWVKWLFIPLAFIATSWGQGRDFHWTNLLISVVVTEFLVYSARYQWNDIRGLSDDNLHPLSTERLRLPQVESRRHARFVVYSSLSVAVLRLLAALVVGLALGRLGAVLILVAAVFFFAVVYEALRTCEAEHPAAARSLWFSVGAGYAIRFLVGAFTASEPPYSALSVVASVFFHCFGVMFVLMTWLLEGTSFCSAKDDDNWFIFPGALRRKRHVRLLLDYLGSPRIENRASPLTLPDPAPGVKACEKNEVLRESRNLTTLLVPWNIAFLCASVMSVPTGLLLSGGPVDPVRMTVGVLLGLGAGCLVMTLSDIALQMIVAFTGSLGLVLTSDSDTLASDALTVSPWLLSAITYSMFRQQSYFGLKNFGKELTGRAKGALLYVRKKVIGADTWRKIG
ncbi:hypothetical protein GCM10010302_09690 [Streptomyces polychromogenes]|uniref:Uncharacterized protein n=1 Tax=Streptomyces polychromogenes TaxID=67342 RepID=A0ABN0V4C1_9ACTN